MFHTRLLALALVIAVGFLLVLGRLAQLQVVQGHEYRRQRENRRHQLVQVPPRRGTIYDAKGRILAIDRPVYELWLVPAKSVREGRKRVVRSLLGDLTASRILELAQSREPARSYLREAALRDLQTSAPFLPPLAAWLETPLPELAATVLDALLQRHAKTQEALTLARPLLDSVPAQVFLAIRQKQRDPENAADFAAIETRIGMNRIYPHGTDFCHLVGTVGPLTESDYEALRGQWDEEKRVPGEGVIFRGGVRYFDIRDPFGDEVPDHQLTPPQLRERQAAEDERSIIRLREGSRAGITYRYAAYFRNEIVGKTGIEAYYNQHLRGRHVWRRLRLERPDPQGPLKLLSVGKEVNPQDGADLRLTIDLDVQGAIRQAFLADLEQVRLTRRGRNGAPFQGACVVMNPQNGRIYAMVSVPGFDPNEYRQIAGDLFRDPRRPLYNRCIAGTYPPGSVMKPIVALGALTDGVITPDTTFLCEGKIRAGNRDFICFRRHVHGNVNVMDALKVSCNVFFYQAGAQMRSKNVLDWAWNMGLGHRTQIDLLGEKPGILPRKRLSLGETYHLAIGQGRITVTPLQMAVACSAIANGGFIVRPHVVADPRLDEPRGELALDPLALDAVRTGMRRVVAEQGGTAHGHWCAYGQAPQRYEPIPHAPAAGKTGSAEWRKGRPTHAWFISWAPFENPQVVCVVVVPEGNFGGGTAAPIAWRLLHVLKRFGIFEEGPVG